VKVGILREFGLPRSLRQQNQLIIQENSREGNLCHALVSGGTMVGSITNYVCARFPTNQFIEYDNNPFTEFVVLT